MLQQRGAHRKYLRVHIELLSVSGIFSVSVEGQRGGRAEGETYPNCRNSKAVLRNKRACKPSKSRCSPPPMGTPTQEEEREWGMRRWKIKRAVGGGSGPQKGGWFVEGGSG
ncbi:hypothetical protein EVAR_46129_1 [Eumeta japonica]|uniref:Uncharacterized protein n=1 Tax=Eumeta variegata TaxID=151549 RepID=A0A4C1XRC7_EUMVA|nr:hypothetical protein EVAR_46129_1 [Eumeta japonica]